MDISSEKVIDKMDELLHKAKNTESHEKLRGYVTAIQALCDILLEETGTAETYSAGSLSTNVQSPAYSQPAFNQSTVPVQPVISSVPQSKPVKMDDANGDSLFDF
ncbi:YwdI family protein [Peribacillus glennii]|uniref:YwdI family protein n=1 Tax=Peribacillus glennii TaxID=2303991 RepID=A0A372LAQ4_9BACI|nr:YwdI family protein [Peribacillus glennii]RFU62379.1 hypothetical protein D0466_14460 [Peribacillus glennii]